MKLISTIHPHYWQLGLGLLLGLVATAGQLIVPTIAKSLINALGHAVNMNLVIGVVLVPVSYTHLTLPTKA